VYFGQGYYAFKHELPAVPGFEGAGKIVAVGENVDKSLVGKNVGAWHDSKINSGTWGDFFVADKDNFIEITEENPDYSQYSSPFINPFTVAGFLEVVKREHADSVLLSAGSSALAKMAVRLFASQNISTTVLVRKDEYIPEIKSLGAKSVVNENIGE
jgi:NADPH:quinone reductase-like Zn-dependent oxidoreductase